MSDFRLDVVEEERSGELCELFASEAQDSEIYSWQDREPNFYNRFKHIKTGKATYFLGYEGDKLVASFGAVPVSEYKGKEIIYGSDFFVHSDYRKAKTAWNFVAACSSELEKRIGDGMFWGIENIPGAVQGFFRFQERSNMVIRYIGTSLMREIFVDSDNEIMDSNVVKSASQLGKENYKDKIESTVSSRKATFYVPPFTWEQLKKLDPDFKIIEGECSLALIDMSRVIKFKIGKKQSPWLKDFFEGDLLKYLVASPLGDVNKLTEDAIQSARTWASQNKFGVISFRDVGHENFFMKIKEQVIYPRKVFVISNKETDMWQKIFEGEKEETRLCLDSSFL